jgi:hypothetical protein
MNQNPVLAQLSLTARLAVALACMERYCHAQRFAAPELTEFFDYLWEFPTIHGPDIFALWERKHPVLVDVGLGAAFPDDFAVRLQAARIESPTFRTLLEHTVEIIFGSFYGAADNQGALTHLQYVLEVTDQSDRIMPLLPLFAHSRFADGHGWGNHLSMAERDAWRNRSQMRD